MASGWDRPAEVNLPLSDDFSGRELGIQWSFHQHFDPARFALPPGAGGPSIEIGGFGVTPGESRPMCVTPMDLSYEVSVDVEVEAGATAGLMLFTGAREYLGLAIASDGQIRRVQSGYRRYARTEEPSVGSARTVLRIVNEGQDVRFHHRDGASSWRVMQPSMEIASGGIVQAESFRWRCSFPEPARAASGISDTGRSGPRPGAELRGGRAR